MPSQIVHLPESTHLAILNDHHLAEALAIGDMRATALETDSANKALRIHLASLVHAPNFRDLFADEVYGLLLTSAPSQELPAPPRPLPDNVVLAALDMTEWALLGVPDLTGHEKLAIHAAFEEARNGRPVARALRRRGSANAYESILLYRAARIQQAVASTLARLDDKLASYQASLQPSGMGAAVLRLGLQTELGLRLALDPGEQAWAPRLVGETRRCGLGGLLRTTHNVLAAFQQIAEAIHEESITEENWLQPSALAEVHATLVSNVPGLERAGRLRARKVRIRSRLDGHITILEVPQPEIKNALSAYATAFDASLWRDIHPLIRCSLACLEFLRIAAYSDATGRMARLIMQGLMLESSIPALPLAAVLEWNRSAYIASVNRGIQQHDGLAFVQFALNTVEQAIVAGQHMTQVLKPACEQVRNSFCRLGASDRFALVASEFTGSMVLGPDPQVVRRTIHGVELSWYLHDSQRFDVVDGSSLGLTLSGYDSDTAFSSPVARALAAAPPTLCQPIDPAPSTFFLRNHSRRHHERS